jgi:hypothetical protein
MRWLQGVVVSLAVAASVIACGRTFSGRAVQPNPLVTPRETLRASEKIIIVTGDMELRVPYQPNATQRASPLRTGRYPLVNGASFTLVSRDRLRFHVQIEHKWSEWADLSSWDVTLEDDAGHRYTPESVEHARVKHLVTMWDMELQTARRNMYGDIVALNDDGWKRRTPLGSLSVFRGNADFVFYKRDLFNRGVRWLRLTVTRPGQTFEYTWDFTDSDGEPAAPDAPVPDAPAPDAPPATTGGPPGT